VVRIELITHVNVITLNDDIHLYGPQILFYLKNYSTLGSNGYDKTLNTYMHNIGVIWLNAPPSTIMDSRKNCYLVASGLQSVGGHLPSGGVVGVPRLG
jgi:hypothetical protein